jgi:hypothetical protein
VVGGKHLLDSAMSDLNTPEGRAKLQDTFGFLDQVAPLFNSTSSMIPRSTPMPVESTPRRVSSRHRQEEEAMVCQPCLDVGILECDRRPLSDPGRGKACARCKRKKLRCMTLDGIPLRRTKQYMERNEFDEEVSPLYPFYPLHPDMLTSV